MRCVTVLGGDAAWRERLAAGLAPLGWQAVAPDAGRSGAVVLALDADGAGLPALLGRVGASPALAIVSEDSVAAAMRALEGGAGACVAAHAGPAVIDAALRALLPPAGTGGGDPFAELVADAPAMQGALGIARQAAASRISVLVTGPSGSGKESLARALHRASPRGTGPFRAINCGALPEALVESLLFGHEKGAFTGAERRHAGLFREADGGSVFLDEVGELPPTVQVKLLRVLQESEVDPVGGRAPVRVDVRVISATNRDLGAEIAGGGFREDLFFRLAGVEVRLPPLSARTEDILPLALRHAQSVARMEGRRFSGFGPDVGDWLMSRPWPGNVRELQNVVHRAMVMCETPIVPRAAFEMQIGVPAPEPPARGSGAAPARGVRRLEEVEAEAIADALMICGGQVSETARRLGIGRSTLYRKMRAFGIAPDASDEAEEERGIE